MRDLIIFVIGALVGATATVICYDEIKEHYEPIKVIEHKDENPKSEEL